MRAYGIEFREGPDGFGVYASKDIEPLRRARVVSPFSGAHIAAILFYEIFSSLLLC